jgi:holliday junction DNA helicase RuvB
MTAPRNIVSAQPQRAEEDYEKALRPRALDEFIGQAKIKDNLRVFLTAALQRGESLDHVLLSGPPGLGKCITPDTLVLTREGWVEFARLIPAGMEPGEARPVTIEVQGALGLESASHVYYSGCVPTVRIRTRGGFEIEGTHHHPVLVATDAGPTWKRLGDLTPGDAVAVSRGACVPGRAAEVSWTPEGNAARRQHAETCTARAHAALTTALGRPPAAVELRRAYAATTGADNTPTPLRTARRLGLPLSDGRRVPTSRLLPDIHTVAETRTLRLDADVAYLLGALVGDGHAEADGGYVLTCTEAQVQGEVVRTLRERFGRDAAFRAYGHRAARLGIGADMGRALRALDLSDASAADKSVPSTVLAGTPEIVRGFLQGLFDADGHARADGVELGTRSERLAREVQLLLTGFGVIAYRKRTEKTGSPFWTLYVGGRDALRFYRAIGFRLARKQARGADLPEQRAWRRSDLVPGAAALLTHLLRATGPHPRTVHKAFGHAVRGERTLSRQQAARLLALLPDAIQALPEASALAALLDPRLSWDTVAATAPGEADTYDFVVPGTHTFVAGGLVNHNTTLAYIIAEEMGAKIKTTSGPALDKPASIAGLLTNLEAGDVLFIDEIHRLSPVVEEYLYSAMEDYAIDILIDSGPSARSVRLSLPPFTLVGATTRKGLLTAPLRARFGIDFRYDYYSAELLQRIVLRSAAIVNVEIEVEGAYEIARRSRGTPRIANRLLRRARDFAEVHGDGRVTRALADYALNALEVDEAGLDEMDARILMALMQKFDGGPVGLTTLAVAVSEDAGTLEEVYEPYLIQEGFMARTARGRIATGRAYEHFGVVPPPRQSDFFDGFQGGQL